VAGGSEGHFSSLSLRSVEPTRVGALRAWAPSVAMGTPLNRRLECLFDRMESDEPAALATHPPRRKLAAESEVSGCPCRSNGGGADLCRSRSGRVRVSVLPDGSAEPRLPVPCHRDSGPSRSLPTCSTMTISICWSEIGPWGMGGEGGTEVPAGRGVPEDPDLGADKTTARACRPYWFGDSPPVGMNFTR
jgi:hypothetical protein